jgi:hypothetical protein
LKNRKGVTFEKDIIQEVSDDLGLDYKIVEEIYYINNRYIRYLADKTVCTNIILPTIGNMYQSYYSVLNYINSTIKSEFELGNIKYEFYLKKKILMKQFYLSQHRSKRAYIKNFMKPLINKMKAQIRKVDGTLGTIQEIEKIQRDYYEKTK